MEENEGKDLAQNMKEEQKQAEKYYENVNLELSKILLENVTIGEKHEEKQVENGEAEEVITYEVYIDFKGESVLIATIDESGNLTPNESILQDEKYDDEDRKKLGDMLNLLGLEKDEVNMEKLQEQLKTIDAKTKEELEQEKGEKTEEIDETTKDDNEGEEKEEEDLEKQEEKEKEKIAKKYKINTNQIIHVDLHNEKITEDETFARLVSWADGQKEIYVIPGEDEYSWKTIGRKEGEEEFTEIKAAHKQIHGKNPNITIQKIGNDKITEIRPLAMYEIDSDTAIAIIRNEYGEPEQLYCRKQEGEQKYWGTVIPEASKKNVRQLEFDARSFMSAKNTSALDLEKKEDELKKAQSLNDRGIPSKEDGVQVYEIDGSQKQNRELVKEEIVSDLMKRDGIVDKLTVPPGYYENKAEKVLRLMEQNQEINYEQAVEQIDRQGEREERWKNSRGRNRVKKHLSL